MRRMRAVAWLWILAMGWSLGAPGLGAFAEEAAPETPLGGAGRETVSSWSGEGFPTDSFAISADGSGTLAGGPDTPSGGTGTSVGGPDTPSGGSGTPVSDPDTPSGGTGTPAGDPDTPSGGTGTPAGDPDTPTGGSGTPAGDPDTPSGGTGTPVGDLDTPTDGTGTPAGDPDTPSGGTGTPAGDPDTPSGGTGTPAGDPDTPSGGTDTPAGDPDVPPDGVYQETLGPCTIGDGEMVSYTTISSDHQGSDPVEGYYPGELTLTIAGPVVVEAGGCLSVGTLSLGGPEASPVLAGTCREEGLILVKAGGRLRLNDVLFETDGEGPFIVQEPGGSVELTMTDPPAGLIQWAGPLVDNQQDTPEDVWLEEGTPLTRELLPRQLATVLENEGRQEDRLLSLEWDLSGYDGRTQGELTLSGSFLGEDGQPIPSVSPLTVTVHWYTPGQLVVSEGVWKGSQLPIVQLAVLNLPPEAIVWGEVSRDEGRSWERWESEDIFYIVPGSRGEDNCIFVLSDQTPGLFRVAARNREGTAYWRSEAFALGPGEGEDSGGNRGGATSPISPDRKPQPPQQSDQQQLPAAAQSGEASEVPADQTAPVSDPAQSRIETPASSAPSSLPEDEAASPADSPADGTAPSSREETASESAADLSLPVQGLLGIGGAAVCGAAGLTVARMGIFRKKK